MLHSPKNLHVLIACAATAGVLAFAGCGGGSDNGGTTTAAGNAQSTTPAETAPSATTPSNGSTTQAGTQSQSKTSTGSTTGSTSSTAPPNTTRTPKPIRSATALAAGKSACKGKTPKQIANQYLPQAKAANPAWSKSPQAKQLLAFLDKAPPQAQANPQFAPVAAIVYALSVKGAKERQDAFNGCVTALGGLASTAAPPSAKK